MKRFYEMGGIVTKANEPILHGRSWGIPGMRKTERTGMWNRVTLAAGASMWGIFTAIP